MIVDPFPEGPSRPTVLHVRTIELSDRKAPFIRQTILGLRPYFRNVVLTPSVDGEIPDDLHVECVSLRAIRDKDERAHLLARLREKYPSISIVVGHMGNGSLAGALIARSLDVPILGIFGGSDINVEFRKPRYRAIYEELIRIPSARFLTVADYLRQKVTGYGGQADRLFTWHRGVDLGHAQLAQHAEVSSGDPIKAIVTGRLLEVKGHEFLIRALALLRKRNIEVEANLIGDGPLQSDLEALAQKLGVADLVKFHGHLSHTDVLERLAAADLYVHPSVTCNEGRTEGVPNAIMEAHAAGLPVVATDSGGIREVVLDARTGFLVPERNPEALSDRIAELAKDRALRLSMGARGRSHIEANFALQTQSRRLAAHITHTIQAGKLFTLRGWNVHRPQNNATNLPIEAGYPDDTHRIMKAVSQSNYDSTIPLVGPVITLARRVVWTIFVRPYLRSFAREFSRFSLTPAARNHAEAAAIGGQAATPTTSAETAMRANTSHAQIELPDRPRMCDAACADCPHCPVGEPWPEQPCPLDHGCRTALESEFAARAPHHSPLLENDALRLTDQELTTGQALPYADRSQTSILLQASPQTVVDKPERLREVARILATDGTLTLDIGPLPEDPDAASLHSDSTVPFARYLFAGATLARREHAPSGPTRPLTVTALDHAIKTSGLTIATHTSSAQFAEPCPIDFQARFSLALRHIEASKDQVAPRYYAVLRHPRAVVSSANPIPTTATDSK